MAGRGHRMSSGSVERRWVWARAAVLVPLIVVMALVVLAGFGRS
jgi:hypothetical protein